MTLPAVKLTDNHDHIVHILLAFLATLGCYTAVAILGADGENVLRDVLLALGGGLTGVAISARRES